MRVLACLVVLSVLLIACGGAAATATPARPATPSPTATPVPTPTPTPTPIIGQNDHWLLTLDRAERVTQVGTDKHVPEGIYLVAYLTLKNVGTHASQMNDWDFSVVNPARSTKYNVVSVGGSQTLHGYASSGGIGKSVQPDLSIKFYLIFDVPTDVTDLVLSAQELRLSIPTGR